METSVLYMLPNCQGHAEKNEDCIGLSLKDYLKIVIISPLWTQ